VPIGRGRALGNDWGTVANALAGGWQLNGVTTIYGGLPFNPGFDAPAGAIRPNVGPAGRPDRGEGSPYAENKGRNGWLATGLGGPFLLPANNTFGNFGRNQLRGPRLFQQDLSIFKRFVPREGTDFQVRAEAFNVFNHTNLGMPNSNVTSPEAGRITGLAASGGESALGVMRRLQFGLRFSF
jgi:hypothetical protein